jgi:peptidoglycan/xylan/chitin deacetylase (PgdA/CDA1 family)
MYQPERLNKKMSFTVPVLIYHHVNPHAGDTVTVTPEVFEAQMAFLVKSGFTTLSIDELMEALAKGQKIGKKAVVLTFDDGWLDNYLYAIPVLKRLKFRASFFIITGRVDASSNGRVKLFSEIPLHEAAKACIQSGESARVVLDWDLIRGLEGDGLFRCYSHTVSHRRCAELSSEELQIELVESRLRIESELGRACPYLCWPYGSYSDDTIRTAQESGYTGLFTTDNGFCGPASDPLKIERIEVRNSVAWMQELFAMI